jgi:hypothetical protein
MIVPSGQNAAGDQNDALGAVGAVGKEPAVGQNNGIDLDTVADELYGALPSEFTSRRDALAGEARRAGDRALAAEIKKLRRPTMGAWLANLLVRERRDEVARLLDLGSALRQAQATLATGDLRRLSQERHRLLTDLEQEAGRLADRHGQAVSGAVAQELSDTLEAATADPDAADALRAGRLTTGLHYSGLGPGLVSVPDSDRVPDRRPDGDEAAAAAAPAPPGPEPQSRERPTKAETTLKTAETALTAAEEDSGQKQRRLDEAREKRDRCTEEVTDLERQLRALRKREEEADDEVRAAKKALDAAEHAVIGARDELVRARAAVEQES